MIYTTYFAKLRHLPSNIFPISICAKAPDWYKGEQYKKLSPPYELLMSWKKNHDEDYYVSQFKSDVLDKLTPSLVLTDLELKLPPDIRDSLDDYVIMNKNYHIALVCYEKPEDFCHRHLVADWLRSYGDKIGICIEVKEFEYET